MAFPSRLRLAAAAAVLLALPEAGRASVMPNYAFSNFDEPNASIYYFANCLNYSGYIVGSYDGTGFLLNTDGSFQDIMAPGQASLTTAIGINNAGQILGVYADGSGGFGTFLRGANSTYATIATPVPFSASGLNDAAQIVGSGGPTSFVIDASGTATALPAAPGGEVVSAYGINNAAQIVGDLADAAGLHCCLLAATGYTAFDEPSGGCSTFATAINNAGQIVGYTTDANLIDHGFLDIEGAFLSLDDPAATAGTVALGINDAGAIVGYYMDAVGQHAFLATPSVDTVTGGAPVPEPGSVALLGAAAALLGLFGCRRPA